ncbi:MAG TPA: AIR synthase family protein [Longilinea sp.]|nr:AIR synthase family protein [Longilinea sp.]
MNLSYPVGKLPPAILARILADAPLFDDRVRLGPGIGLDCAVVDAGEFYWVFKAEPITFATDQIGWYAVQVASNDIATTGAEPRFILLTLLLPEGQSDETLVRSISDQVFTACRQHRISVLGGHTEVTHGIDRPLLAVTMIGEVAKDKLVTPRGAQAGDVLLLTKGIPIEATALLAREFPNRLQPFLTRSEINEASSYLNDPGISILSDAQVALEAGRVTAMHDPTEGGLSAALWELAQACGKDIDFDPAAVTISDLSKRICQAFALDPFATLASGALLLTVHPEDVNAILAALQKNEIAASRIGKIVEGSGKVFTGASNQISPWPYPERDEIGKVYG